MPALAEIEWFPEERLAWRVPERMLATEWSDRYRRLSSDYSAEPGRYSTARTPYFRVIIDSVGDEFTERVTVRASAQIGKTEAMLCMLGYGIDQDPGPTLYVMPSEDDARGLAADRIRKLVEETPQIRRHLTIHGNDLRGDMWRFVGMVLRFAWPTAGRLASFPAKRVFLDEVDKFEKTTGKEANPIRLAEKRTDTFKSTRKIVTVSTPALTDGHVTVEYEKGSQEEYWVPCPHCGQYAPLRWSQVKWPEDCRDAEQIKMQRLAWYECGACNDKILDHHKPQMLERGVWCPRDSWVEDDGTLGGDPPRTSHRSFHIWAAYSPWVSFSELVSEWLLAQGKPEDLQDFVNSRLAEPWSDIDTETEEDALAQCMVPIERGTSPAAAGFVATTCDVQKDGIWWVARAWGPQGVSWGIDYGWVPRLLSNPLGDPEHDQWAVFVEEVLLRRWDVAGVEGSMPSARVLIDSGDGNETEQIYALCARYPGWLIPSKGSSTSLQRHAYDLRTLQTNRRGQKRDRAQQLMVIDVDAYKSKLAHQQGLEMGSPCAWHVGPWVGKDYQEQMTSEHRVRDRKSRRRRWVLKPGKTDNHLWDCEVYNLALGEYLQALHMTPETAARNRDALVAKEIARKKPPRRQPPQSGRSGRGRPWIDRKGSWHG